jgi:hypothetical protein
MSPHTWITEEIDGGALGVEDFYLCSTCGCAGGAVGLGGVKPKPFLPGPAIDLSDDCMIAQEQVLFFVHGYLRSWVWSEEDTLRTRLHALMREAHRLTPKTVSRVEFSHLAWTCDEKVRPPAVESLQEQLLGLGFKLAEGKKGSRS